VVPSCPQGRRPSPCSNRVGFHIGLFRGLLGVHSRCGLPARRTAEAVRCLEGFDGFVASTAAPIATGWSDQLSGRELHPLKIRAFSRRTATYAPSCPETVRGSPGLRSPAERLNGRRYHPGWLQNLLVSASLGGIASLPEKRDKQKT
jgi:hypothetical protein